jgi:hypothetical protein
MTEIGVRPPQKETEDKVDSPQEATTAPLNEPVAKPSIWSRMARPVAALFGATAIGGVGVAATQGGESDSNSRKAPDAIVAPPAQDFVAESPEKAAQAAATKAQLEQVTQQQQEQQTQVTVPEMSEDEKRERSRAILEAYFPQLLPILENGAHPYYEEGIEPRTGRHYEGVSFVSKTAPGFISNIDGLNASLINALAEHYFHLGVQGYDKSQFEWVEKDGKLQVDFKDSETRIQKGVRDTKRTIAVVVPPDAPWPWPSDEFTKSDPMFDMHTIIQGDTLVLLAQFHPDQVKNSHDDLMHHPEGRPPKNPPPGYGGAS